MSTIDRMTRAFSFGHGREASPTLLNWARAQVADARARVELLARRVEDDTRRGNPATKLRALLATFQQILRETIVRRDAVSGALNSGKPRTERSSAEGANRMATTRATIAQLDALVARDPSRGTPAQRRAFDAVFALAMEGKPVDAELLAIALAMPAKPPASTQ